MIPGACDSAHDAYLWPFYWKVSVGVVLFKAGEVSPAQFIFNEIAILKGPFPTSE